MNKCFGAVIDRLKRSRQFAGNGSNVQNFPFATSHHVSQKMLRKYHQTGDIEMDDVHLPINISMDKLAVLALSGIIYQNIDLNSVFHDKIIDLKSRISIKKVFGKSDHLDLIRIC